MTTLKTLLLALAASVPLAACSSEPSDWRPGDKVSLDLVDPGTRDTENFGHAAGHDPNHDHSGPVTTPGHSPASLDIRAAPTAAEARSANDVPRGQPMPNRSSVIADTAASGRQIQR